MSTKKKWAGALITEHNVDEYLSDLAMNKGRHITQGVSFNKEDATQMNLLRLALIRHGSFSGFVKFLLAEAFKEANVDWETHPLAEEVLTTRTHQKEYQKKTIRDIKQGTKKEKSIVEDIIPAELEPLKDEKEIVELEDKSAGEITPIKKRKNSRSNFSSMLTPKQG